MKQQRVVALAAVAYVLYVLASVGAGAVPLDAGSIALAVSALVCALLPLFATGQHVPPGEAAVGFELGPAREQAVPGVVSACLAVLLAARLSVDVHPLVAELLFAVVSPVVGLFVLRLSLRVPDTPVRLLRHVGSEALARAVGGVALLLGLLAAVPPVWLFGRPLIAPHRFAYAPPAFALACVVIATALRLFRRRLGSDARALSANLWATLGSLVGLALVAGVVVARALSETTPNVEHAALALAAALFALGHLWLVSPRRAIVAGRWARELFALVASFALATFAYLEVAASWPTDVLGRVLLVALLLGVFATALALFRRIARFVLAPHRGRLLDALVEASRELPGAASYEELAGRVLRPLRRASLSPEAAPLLACFHPERELRLDAAGHARALPRPLPRSIAQRLASQPGEILVRDDLAARLVRRPELRELVAALDELGALCVVPLSFQGELEGALVVARGARRDPLTLEELDALAGFAEQLAASSSVFLMAERTNQRLTEALARNTELAAQLEELRETEAELRAESQKLKATHAGLLPASDLVAYSQPMASLCERLHKIAGDQVPVLLVSELGTPLAPLARLLHMSSGRADAPFIVVECSELLPEEAMATLFGGPRGPGLVELTGRGTLLLCDLPALEPEVQRALSRALAERRASPTDGGAAYPVELRLVASARRGLTDLVASGAVKPELARWLESATFGVPALRERREDIESLVLKALDRAARVRGRPVLGVAPDAMKALYGYDWPGNVVELELVVQRAAATAKGTRITLDDLPPLPVGHATAGSYLDQEREILRRALEKAGGSKTRAARELGIKRTTLLDKLRRLGLEDPKGPTEH